MIAKKLKYGDTIGIVSPASPENVDSIEKGVSFIKKLGFNVKLGKHIYDKNGYLAGSDKDRANDIMDMFLDNTVSMILCIRGGYGSMRILPYIDFDIIKNNPKIFVGFSDITTLLNNIYSKCGLITFHGPMASSKLDDKYTLKSFLDTLMVEEATYTIDNPPDYPIECSNNGITEGILVGGNLCLLTSTLGTPYELDTKDKILFIEDVGEAPYKIDRMLTQLLLAGKLTDCTGFILGQFKNCSLPHYERSFTLDEVLNDRLLSLKKPTLKHFMSGHSYPKLTIPIGSKIRLDCNKGIINILEPVIK